MDLQQRIRQDMRQAMRSGDALQRDLLRLLRSEIGYAEIAAQNELDDAMVVDVVSREIRKRRDALVLYRQGKRDDLVAKADKEIAHLERYLPPQLSEDEIRSQIQRIIDELASRGQADLGSVMRTAMPRMKGQVDGKVVNQIVRELLSQ